MAVAVYGNSVKTRSETSPGTWTAESQIARGTGIGKSTVASLPHDRTVAVWTESPGGPLKWSENASSGWRDFS